MPNDEQINTLENVDKQPQTSIENTDKEVQTEKLTAREKLEKAVDEAIAKPKDTKDEKTEEGKDVKQTTEPENKTLDKAKEQQTTPTDKPTEPAKEAINAPHSWKAEIKKEWEAIPEASKKYILERESDMQKKLGEVAQEVGFSREIKQTLEPYNQLIQQLGTNPREAINEVMSYAKIMHTGSHLQKLETISKIAQQHKIDLRLLFNQEPDVQNQLTNQHLQHQNYMLQQNNQNIVSQQQKHLEQQDLEYRKSLIDQFKADKTDFEALEPYIAQIIPSIFAQNPSIDNMQALQMAYENAKWLNPDIRQQQINAQLQQAQQTQKQASIEAAKQRTAKAQNMSSSIKGSTGAKNTEIKTRKSPREEIARMLEEAGVA